MTEEPQATKSPQPRPGRLTRLHDWLSFWLGRVLIVGPDAAPTSTKAPSVAIAQASVSSVTTDRTPADTKTKSDESSVWDAILSWPVRLLLVGLVFVVGRIWHNEPVGIQLGWGLQYGLLLAVSIVASCWFYVGLVNLVVAGVWVLFSWNPDIAPRQNPPRWVLADYITWRRPRKNKPGPIRGLC